MKGAFFPSSVMRAELMGGELVLRTGVFDFSPWVVMVLGDDLWLIGACRWMLSIGRIVCQGSRIRRYQSGNIADETRMIHART